MRLLRYGRGVDNRRLREEVGYEPRYDAVGAVRDFAAKTGGRRLGPEPRTPARSPGGSAGAGAMSAAPPADASAPEALADFLRGLRGGVEAGLDPLAAAQRGRRRRCRAGCATRSRRSRARLRGEYHEDEWGFDEEFAEAVFPLFEFLYDVWWRVEADGRRATSPPHGRALLVANHAGSLFPFDASMITMAIMKRAPAAALAAVHGPRLGLRAAVPLAPSCAASAASRRAPHNADPAARARTSW